MSKNNKKIKTINIDDYKSLIVDYPYNRNKKIINDHVNKADCKSINRIAIKNNTAYFNTILHESILYHINKRNIIKRELKISLALSLNELDLIYNEDKFHMNLNFKFVYDICLVIGLSMAELIERMEGEFTK